MPHFKILSLPIIYRANTVFVSASNGGTESGGVVTWPVVAGPVYPPACVTRYVTIRYTDANFNVGDSVTNNASVTADYLDSSGNIGPLGTVTDPITHPIDPIAAVPTYNKNDAGDPVGIDGTARFILDLDTNGTNYPSNALTLIDNLPPELQVTEVTSGRWSSAFDHVQAFVEYSTNNGSSYTAFGAAVDYNSNITFTAPVTNITNVRWRFQYDPDGIAPFTYVPGLPYTWSFTTSPEIRVTPRAAATTADAPSGLPMPVAVEGATYNNCLQVSRIDNTGAVLDACNNETMTVQGNYVSLRTYKSETNGASWDGLDDPTIIVFTPDTNLLPGDTLRYTITVEVTERSSAPLINPTIFDTLPADLVFVRNGTAQLDGVSLPAGQQPTFTQSGQNLTWAWNNPTPALTVNPLVLGSQYLTVEFFARIPAGQAPGTRTNNLYVVTDSVDVLCEIPTQVEDSANGDVDGDGAPADPACQTTDTYIVERSAALRGEKWIRSTDPLNIQVVDATTFLPDAACPNGGTVGLPGEGSNPFTRFPCISQAFPEGALIPGQFVPPSSSTTLDNFEYNLRIFNDGNVNMRDYVLYDILPYYGDKGSGGTLENSARNSEFRPVLRGPIQFISGTGLLGTNFTIEYNATTNPCRPEVFNANTGLLIPAGCNNTWTSDWTTARSYRIRLNAGSVILPAAASEVRFGVPMYIPADAPLVGTFNNDDAISHEIAWNSFSHVGSYETGIVAEPIRDLLASEPRKVGITIPEIMSVGNRVWRDADNSGTINAPDDSTPGIAGVTVNLYRDVDDNGIADGPAIATTITDGGGYYLFSNIPYDSADMDNNRYIIGVPASNFSVGQPLESLRSSTGTPAVDLYRDPPSNTTDNADDGIDPATVGNEVFSTKFILQPGTEPLTEADLSANDRDGPAGTRRGLNGERDNASDLTIDFGFFGGTDIPFSIGNHVWKDNGETAPGVFDDTLRNDGIRQSTEPVVAGALVRLYRDGDADGIPEASEMIRTDLTDVNGFYLFDNLDPGRYYVEVAASNFASGQPLAGWHSSQPTGVAYTDINSGPQTVDIDNDDDGINTDFPETDGVFSGVVILARGTPEPTGELFLSNEADPGSPANQTYNPTGWDGLNSRGRFGETDSTSNLTIDFGFIPPMSLGNRVWIDEGAGTTPFRTGYDNGMQDGTEIGVSGARVELWLNTNATAGLQVSGATPDTLISFTTTDASGYYLFENLQPSTEYYVHIPAVNFTVGNPLQNFLSSTDANQTTPPVDGSEDSEDTDDNGIDSVTPSSTGITSSKITMSYDDEPLTPANETDINTSGTYGPQNRGNYGQADGDSNLTIDFGFVRPPRSLGNRLWIDSNNNGQVDGGELPVSTGVRVSLYLDADADNQPDDLGVIGDRTDDGIAYDLTDAAGYYLFDNLPPNIYIVGVDRANFASGGSLDGYTSSTGSVDNAANNTDDRDNGVDRLLRADPVASPHGILSTRIDLTTTPVNNAPTGEVGSGDTSTALGFNPTAGDGPTSSGRYGETDLNSDLTIDFGFFIPMSLGNRVFLDDGTGGGTYNNGIMDGTEIPFANVRVELYRDADNNGVPDTGGLVGFDTTDVGGYYLFDNLPEGSYVVSIPSGNFTASFDPDGGGPLPTAAGKLYGYNSSTPTGTENAGVAGDPYTPNTDRDDNGINSGTPSTTGILSGTIVLAHNSEPTGESELSGQADPGSSANLAVSPTGWDGPTSRGRWEELDANSNLTIDFGFIPVFSLGNRVWFDTNNSSTINGGEAGVNNVRVRLYAADGVTEILVGPDGILNTADDAVGGMLTAGGGYYRFNNLLAGDYVVVIPSTNFDTGGTLRGYWSSATTISAAGVISETTAALANSDTDSDDNGTLSSGAVFSSVVTLGPTITSEPAGETNLSGGQGQPDRQANMTVDFGFYRVAIGNLVYLDNNFNGTYDGGAPDTLVSGASVRLYASNGTTEINVGPDGILGTTDDAPGGMITNGSGVYSFTGLPQGDYIVKTTTSTGTVSTIDTFSAADNAAPNTNVNNNDNGIGTGAGVVSSGITTLTPGSTGALGNTTVTNGTGTTSNLTVDFGFVGMVAIGNRVWLDDGAGGGISNNGILDGTETGVSNVTVELYTSTGTFVTSTTTDASGYYQFDQLIPGTYYVFIPATEFQAGGDLETYYSSAGNGTNETSDNNADENGIDNATPATNGIRSTDYTLLGGSETTTDDQTNYTGTLANANVNFTADFGFTQKYSLGNRVWFDTDNNSAINGSEVGVDGVTVNLYAASDLTTILATDTTSDGGYYLFDDLYPGDYVVSVDSSNFGGVLSGYWSSATSRTVVGALAETTAALANSNTDSDDNGTLQTAAPLNGSVISSVVTLGPSGDTEPINETTLQPLIGQGNQADGRANMTVDFGFYKVSVGDLVWSDADKNGVYDAGELPVPDGTVVSLYAANPTTNTVIGAALTTTTTTSGAYIFDGLASGNYIVAVNSPAGTVSTVDTNNAADTANPNTNINNNDNGLGILGGAVYSNAVLLTAGSSGAQNNNIVDDGTGALVDLGATHNPTVDFGFTPVFSLGNRVWLDTNNDSLLNNGEVGVNGVRVQLYDSTGTTEILVGLDGVLGSADDGPDGMLTVNGGYYLFNGLEKGDYMVVLPSSNFTGAGALIGYWSSATTRNAAGTLTETTADLANTDIDSNDNGTLLSGAVVSSVVTLGPLVTSEPAGELDLSPSGQGQPDTQANMTVDFGFYTITLGSLVWSDADNSGTLNNAEVGINNVTVELYLADSAGNPVGAAIATTTTSGGGLYIFTGLSQGSYFVRIPANEFLGTGDLRNYYSSTGGGSEPAPNPDTDFDDGDDNGSEVGTLGFAGGYIQSLPFILTPGAEASIDNPTGTTNEPRVDFGVFNSVRTDLSITKTDNITYYLKSGTLTYVIVVSNDGPADVIGAIVADTFPSQIASATWVCSATGSAACSASGNGNINDTVDMPVGSTLTYTVTATVTAGATGNLVNTATVTPPTGVIENDNTDNSATDTDEPASITISKDDALTVVAPNSILTYTIIVTNNGAVDLTDISISDSLPAEVTYQSATLPPASAPAPGTPGGTLVWNSVSLAVGASTNFTVTVQVNPTAVGPALANTITATDSVTKATNSDTDTDVVTKDKTKALVGTDQTFTPEIPVLPATLRPVAIGEILTYQISIDVPANSTLVDLKALDILDSGLAFVRCVSVDPGTSGDLSTDLAGGFNDACNAPTNPTVVREPIGSASAIDDGRRMEFTLGDVSNASATTTRTLNISYEVIVLDVAANVDGVNTLNNLVTWTWLGGSLSASADPVEIVEPKLSIDKTALPSIADYGTPINFTLSIEHTAESTIDAFDVIVTDILPPGLQYVTGSAASSGLAPDVINYDNGTGTLTFVWNAFPLGLDSTITFQAIFTGPSPVENSANVAWTSLPIDPQPITGLPVQRSLFNTFSTERWYDPADLVNVYGASDSVRVRLPDEVDELPATGFAPGQVTILPEQPKDKMYVATDIRVEIPKLGIDMPIVGVPLVDGEWDVSWLDEQAGWLNGTAFPGWDGNSVLAGHVGLPSGNPGPFANIGSLSYGDQIIIHVDGQKYIYEVRENKRVSPSAVARVIKHEELPWITLITCKSYNEATGTYTYRVAVRAVLVRTVAE